MKFLHAADLHIDSQLVGLEKLDEAPTAEIRRAPREAFRRLVYLAHAEAVDFVVLAGDIFDLDWKDIRTGMFFNAQLQALHPIPVYIARGNHDAETDILRKLTLPPNAYTFASRNPETKMLKDMGVAIHGQSYATRAVLSDLSAGYPAPVRDYRNIGVLHTSLGGYPAHANYAPCSVQSLISRGYDYWALGHIHARTIVNTEPLIVFPGNIQGRHIRETGPKGCMIVDDASGVLTAKFHPLDVLRWFDTSVDVSEATDAYAAIAIAVEHVRALRSVNMESFLCVRVHVSGATEANRELALDPGLYESDLRSQLLPDDVWLVELRVETGPIVDLAQLRAQDDVQGALFRSIESLRGDLANAGLRNVVQPLKDRMPPEVVNTYETRLDDPSLIHEALDGAERILLAELGT